MDPYKSAQSTFCLQASSGGRDSANRSCCSKPKGEEPDPKMAAK